MNKKILKISNFTVFVIGVKPIIRSSFYVRLVLIPHLGSATWKTRSDMAALSAQNILNGLTGKPMVYSAY